VIVEAADQRKHPLVLVVDDDVMIRMLARETMEQSGFMVEEAENGVQALAAVESLRPDVILLDVVMPELDGFSTCARLQQIPGGARTPVLMLTGLDDLESIDRAYEVGATDFVTKPINWAILGHRVRYMLRASRAIEDLRQSEAKNRALLTAIPDSIVLLSEDGRYQDFRTASESTLPLGPATTLEQSVYATLPGKVAQQFMEHSEKALQTGTVQNFEYELPVNGNKGAFETRIVACLEDAVLAITRDITVRKQAEEELKRAKDAAEASDRAKSSFIAGMSHELRTPLSVIIGNLELAMRGAFGEISSDQQRVFGIMTEASRTLIKLIDSVLNLSRMEANKTSLRVSTFRIEEILTRTQFCVEHLNKERRLQVVYNVAENLPPITTDALKLEEILQNLLSNAFKFTRQGKIEIRVRNLKEEKQVEFSIGDTGIGIPEADHEKIFGSFYQLNEAHTGDYDGVGLGLSIVKGYIALMKGQITVASEPGAGSVFTITLPYSI